MDAAMMGTSTSQFDVSRSPSSPTRAPRAYSWELIVLLWGAFFLNQGDRQVFNSVIPLIREGLGLSDVQIGLVGTIFTVISGLSFVYPGSSLLVLVALRWCFPRDYCAP